MVLWRREPDNLQPKQAKIEPEVIFEMGSRVICLGYSAAVSGRAGISGLK